MTNVATKKIPKLRYTFEQLANVRRIGSCTFSPDGKQMAFVVDLDGQMNLWLMPTVGGFPVQLTFFKDQTVRDIKWSPVSNQIVFTADHKGNELTQLYVLDLDTTARPKPLTDNPKKRYMLSHWSVEASGWSPDGKFVYCCTDDREPRALDVIQIEVATGKHLRLTQEDASLSPNCISPNGRYLPIEEFLAIDHLTLHILDLKTGQKRELTPHKGKIRYLFSAWSPDSRFIYAITDKDSEFLYLIKIDIETGNQNIIVKADWDIQEAGVSPDGMWLAYTINEDGTYIIILRNLKTGNERKISKDISAFRWRIQFTPDSGYLVFNQNEAIKAGNYYLFRLTDDNLSQITDSMSGGIRSQDLITPELIHYKSFDREIPAWFYRPKGEGPFPCVLSIHGGPQGQELTNYYHFYQYLLQAGIAVLAPNIRGSTGYGKTYMRLIDRDWGGDELKDIEYAVKFLQSHPDINNKKIGIYGGSFGGFAVLSAVTRLPDYWCVAVDLVGPSNLITFLESVPEFWKPWTKEWLGDVNDPEDRKFLTERSPINYIDQIKAPLLIIQGANDPRVVKAESDQIVEALRKRDVPVEYLVFEDEGHGFTKTENTIRAYKRSADFFFKHLLEEGV